MLGTLKQSIFSFMGRIPIIRNFVPEEYRKETVITNQSRAELETLHKAAQQFDPNTTDRQEGQSSSRAALIPILENSSSDILNTIPDLKREIASHIERNGLDPKARIDFREEIITNKALSALNTFIANYQTRFPLIQQRSAGSIDPDEYVNLMQQLISKSIKFILEVNNQIIHRTATLDPDVQDHNLAEAFSMAKNISKKIADRAFITLRESFQQLPNFSFEGPQGTIDITNYIRSKLEDNIKTLYLGSQFGLQSAEIFQAFKDQVQAPMLADSTAVAHSTLSLIRAFQEATHGSILINPQDSKIALADLDKTVKEKILDALIQTIIREYVIHHDDIDDRKQTKLIESINNTKKDLADCLIKLDRQESITSQDVIKAQQNPLWTSLKLENKSAEIQTLYANRCSTQSLLGSTNNEMIMGHHHQGQSIRNYLQISPNNPRIDLERMIHEISLLAVMDTLTNFRNRKRQNPVFESYANFQTVPWLKPLYEARCNEYKSWLETEQVTELPTRRLIKELTRLGSELHSISSATNPVFSFRDFCERYKIEDLRNAMFPRISRLTNIGVTALQFELFSKLFSYLKPGEQEGLTDLEVKRIKDLTEFLLEQSTLRAKDGKQIIAPIAKDPLYHQKHEYMKELVGNRGLLIVDAPIIIKFLLNSLGLEHGSTQPLKGKLIEKENALLAAFLFYVLLKYLPEESNNIDSLLKRKEVVTTLIDHFTPLLEQLPVLRNKILKHSLGLGQTIKGGVIPSICQDIEKHLDEYPQRARLFQEIEQKRKVLEEEYLQAHDPHIAKEINQLRIQARQIKPITLDDLLAIHDQLSDCIQRNPSNVKQIQTLLKDSNGSLLKDLRDYVETLIEVEPTTIINFIKTSANQELQTYTKKLLLTQASKLAQELISTNAKTKTGTIQIIDNDEVAIKKYTKLLNLIRYTAFLVNHYGANKVSINSNSIDERDQTLRAGIIQRMNAISELLKRNVVLLLDDNKTKEEVFPGQLEAKRTLVELLQEFGIRSGLEHKIEWTSLKKAEKKLEDSIYREQTIKFPGTEPSNRFANKAA